MSTDPRGPHRVRASDAEREEYAQILRAAMTEGRLSLEEGEERLAKVYAAQYRDELSPLTTDLPDGGRRALYDTPEAREHAHRDFNRGVRRHIGVVAIVAGALVGLWVISGAHFFWPLIPLLFLWFGVLRHLRWARWARWGRGFGGPGWGGRGWGGGPGWGGHGPGGGPGWGGHGPGGGPGFGRGPRGGGWGAGNGDDEGWGGGSGRDPRPWMRDGAA
jgi:Domain of unknown function (DUF1707)